MEQEDKELLLKDLSARLPYDVKVQIIEVSDYTNEYLSPKNKTLDYLLLGKLGAVIKGYRKDDIKPYLFPMSSMTKEQMEELKELCNMFTPDDYYPYAYWGIGVLCRHILDDNYKFNLKTDVIDWLNKNHFDYRGLIEKGLAIDATNKNIY